MLVLALESSTTSAKAMLYSTEDGVINMVTKEYPLVDNDTQTQDAEGVLLLTMQVGKQVSAGRKIDCIVLSGVWHSVVLCDKNMKPQTRVLSWANSQAAAICNQIRSNKEDVIEFYKTTGCMVNAIYPVFKLLYFKEQGYNLEDYFIFGQGSYNTYRLTGKRIVTDCMASGSGLLNIHDKKYDKRIINQIGINESQLCEIVTYKDMVPLSEEGAALLGLNAGIPVIPPCADGALNQVGVGALEEGVMTFSVGTSAAIRLTTSKPIIPEEPSTWCYLTPTSWLSGAATSGACNCTDWFIDNFYQVSYKEIEESSYGVIDSPVFLPFLFGERCPGWQDNRRGAFIGIQPNHKKADFYLAAQEGILFNIFQSYKVLCMLNGKPRKIILSGGILKSNFWTQMCVDIFGVEMEIPTVDQSSLMGAVILASEVMGSISDIQTYKFEKGQIIKPNPQKKEFYLRKYEKYEYWYQKLKY
jgi:gluconokinase